MTTEHEDRILTVILSRIWKLSFEFTRYTDIPEDATAQEIWDEFLRWAGWKEVPLKEVTP